MQLDDLKEAWAAHGVLLERSLAIDERVLRELLLRKVRFAMAPYALWRLFEVSLGFAALVITLPILVAHRTDARYVLVVGALVGFIAMLTWLTAYLLVSGLRLDYDGPVTSIQREVERIKLVEYHTFKSALFGGVVLWLPALLVLFEAVTGVDALARCHVATLGANLLFGGVVLALGQALARKYVERSDLSPWARRMVDGVSGWALRRTSGHLAELARFERDEPLAPGKP